MSASVTIIADLTTCSTTAPTAASKTLANAAAGPLQDAVGNMKLALLKAQELRTLLLAIETVTDDSDPNEDRIDNILASLV